MWRYLGASVQGSSHIRNGTPCQDYSCAVEFDAAGLLFLACSDGAGSGSRSELGSEVACRHLCDEITRFAAQGGRIDDITKETALEWLDSVRSAISTQAEAAGVTTRDLACTLIAAVIAPTAAAFMQIGDGAAVVSTAKGELRVVFWPEQGEFANTTFFLTAPDAAGRFRLEIIPEPISDLALFTDGLQHLALRYDSKTAHAPFFQPFFDRLRSDDDWQELSHPLRAFLSSEAVTKRTDDDCTLVLASRT
jgi:hypothetical protein